MALEIKDGMKTDNGQSGQAADDKALVRQAHGGDKLAVETLMIKYGNLVRGIARRYFLPGGETEDLIQEGMIGLYGAIREYKPDGERSSSFYTFASLCIERRITDAVRKSSRKKNIPMNGYVSIFLTDWDLPVDSPEDDIIMREDMREFRKTMSKILSDFEFRVTVLYMDGASLEEICSATGKDAKSVDNAVQRSRRKLQKVLLNEKRD